MVMLKCAQKRTSSAETIAAIHPPTILRKAFKARTRTRIHSEFSIIIFRIERYVPIRRLTIASSNTTTVCYRKIVNCAAEILTIPIKL